MLKQARARAHKYIHVKDQQGQSACVCMRVPGSLVVPHLDGLASLHLLLQLEDAVEQSPGRRGATGHVDVDGHDAIAAPHHRVGVVIVAPAVGTAGRGDEQLGFSQRFFPQSVFSGFFPWGMLGRILLNNYV